jgi:predicted TIM-barrel fold metal-dependent hydrolase
LVPSPSCRRLAQTEPDHSAGTQRASASLPADACDCHMHVYDPRFAWAPGAKLLHAPATVPMYRRCSSAWARRATSWSPSAYGVDNSCTLDALAQLGATARGVAVVNDQVSDANCSACTRPACADCASTWRWGRSPPWR